MNGEMQAKVAPTSSANASQPAGAPRSASSGSSDSAKLASDATLARFRSSYWMYGTTLRASAAMSPICKRKMAANGHAWRGTARAMSRTATLGLKLAVLNKAGV